jgi:hypothetical protein
MDGDERAILAKGLGNRTTDAAAGPCDQRNFSCERFRHVVLLKSVGTS